MIGKNFLPVLSILLPFIIFLSLPRIILIKEVVCVSQYGECSQTIKELLGSIKGKNLAKAKSMASSLIEKQFLVKDYFLRFQLPNKLVVNLIERKPKYALKSKESGLLVLDEEGVVLSETEASILPTLISDSAASLGQKVDSETLFSLRLVSSLWTIFDVKLATKEKDFLLIELEDGPRVIFPLEGDRDYLVGAFVLIYNQLNKGEGVSRIGKGSNFEIDLRFKNPVLRKR